MMRMDVIRRRSMMGKKALNHTVLNYIQSSGTQYINTGIYPNQDTKVDITLEYVSNTVAGFVFGTRNGTATGMYILYIDATPSASSGSIRSDYNTQYLSTGTQANLAIVSKFRVIKDKNVTSVYNSSGTLISTTTATYAAFTCTASPASIFARNNSTSFTAIAKCYGCKIYDVNGTMLRSFVPVLKSGVYCMYDEVTGNYFYNAGTGSFTGG